MEPVNVHYFGAKQPSKTRPKLRSNQGSSKGSRYVNTLGSAPRPPPSNKGK